MRGKDKLCFEAGAFFKTEHFEPLHQKNICKELMSEWELAVQQPLWSKLQIAV